MTQIEINQWLFWFQFIGAVGAIGTFGAFVFLFLKDRNKENQLERLTTIARSQEQISEAMQREIGELQKHSLIMKEGNVILNKQYELNVTMFQGQQTKEERDELMAKEQREIAEQRHLNEIKPMFHFRTASTSANQTYTLRLVNIRHDAFKLSVSTDSDDFSVNPMGPRVNIQGTMPVHIEGQSTTGVGMREKTGIIDLHYFDAEDNEYSQELRISHGLNVNATDPILVRKAGE